MVTPHRLLQAKVRNASGLREGRAVGLGGQSNGCQAELRAVVGCPHPPPASFSVEKPGGGGTVAVPASSRPRHSGRRVCPRSRRPRVRRPRPGLPVASSSAPGPHHGPAAGRSVISRQHFSEVTKSLSQLHSVKHSRITMGADDNQNSILKGILQNGSSFNYPGGFRL